MSQRTSTFVMAASAEVAALQASVGDLKHTAQARVGELARVDDALEREAGDRMQTEAILRAIIEGTASDIDDEFFRSLVRNLAAALDVRYAFVSELTQVRTRVRTLAFWNGEGFLDNFEMDVVNTPCEQVLRGEMRHYAERVQDSFPLYRESLAKLAVESYLAIPMTDPAGQVLGHLAVMDVKPMPLADLGLWVFRAFGARAGAELARKQAALKLSESQQRLARMFESAMDAIITIDDEQRITLFNQAAAEVFGCDAKAALGVPFERFMSERFRQLLQAAVKEFERSGWTRHFLWGEGLTALRCNGEPFPVDVSLSPFLTQGKRHLTVILRDTLIRRRAELELERLRSENARLHDVIIADARFTEVVATSPAMKKLLQDVERVATTDSTVLITGETGTGKEVIARCIHQASGRKDRVLIKVNCAALSPGLIESELLGHERGAFTGALARKLGRFELAHDATILLDEIGELPMDLQAKLLRVLQEGEFERVGGTVTQKVNVRVLAATNRDLKKAAQDGTFRGDLYYRLNVFPVHIPPLRSRTEDIEVLIQYFVAQFSRQIGRPIERVSRPVIDALTSYDWPGNVRELKHVIERAVILCSGNVLELGEWAPRLEAPALPRGLKTLEGYEREHVLDALELTGWKVSGQRGAAALLGLKATTLEARMKKLGITRSR